ncbi:MAG: restriction endonuclease subunit S [Acidimicrobiaceae bacterium]|nr:restriction endonuclease subunit S [Acidimicrobiaceae bacterium]
MNADLPLGWTEITLAELLDVKYGKALRKRDRVEDGPVGVYGSAGLVGHHDLALVEEPAVIVGRKGNAGAVWVSEKPSWPIDTTYFLRVPTNISARFLAYQLENLNLGASDSSTTIPSLRRPDLEAVSVRLPRRADQDRVVAAIEEHFSRLDTAQRTLVAADSRLHALYRSVAVEAFDRPDWVWTTLGEIAEVKGGITKDSKREMHPEFEEFPYLRVANVQRGYLDLSDIATIQADRRKAQRLILCPGDILFNEGGDRDKLGRGWVWEGQIEDCIHQNHVFRARLLDDRFDPYFVSLHSNSWGQQWFETHGKQTTNLASLNLTTLKSFPVPAPSLREQQVVVSYLRSAMADIEHQRLELGRAKGRADGLRRSILLRAFAGQLLPRDVTRAVS